jgi:hypothetical protein
MFRFYCVLTLNHTGNACFWEAVPFFYPEHLASFCNVEKPKRPNLCTRNRWKNLAINTILQLAPETSTILHRFCRVALVTPFPRRLLSSLWIRARVLVGRQTKSHRYTSKTRSLQQPVGMFHIFLCWCRCR